MIGDRKKTHFSLCGIFLQTSFTNLGREKQNSWIKGSYCEKFGHFTLRLFGIFIYVFIKDLALTFSNMRHFKVKSRVKWLSKFGHLLIRRKGATFLTHNGFHVFYNSNPITMFPCATFSGIQALKHKFQNLYFPGIVSDLHLYFVFRTYCQ